MIERLMLDTNVIIYSLGNKPGVAELIANKEHYISDITEIELLGFHGLGKQDEKIIRDYLSQTVITGLSAAIKDSAIALKRKYKLKTIDAIIAATALYFDLPLVTADKVFKKITELEVISINI